ncbi:MAG: RimK family alpha-L-glutamate ligase [Armatimonadetes bacterium]|nr:RimK family alpha-L-glutamate ligase [Armatimonadota bacterium]
MRKIGIVTSSIERDWISRELLRASDDLALGVVVDPRRFGLSIDGLGEVTLGGNPAGECDAYIVRSLDRRGEVDHQYEVLELLQMTGALVVNSPQALSIAESKALTTFLLARAGIPVPRTVVTQDPAEAGRIAADWGACVLKPLYGSFGDGIELVAPGCESAIVERYVRRRGAACVQEYVPNDGRDIRAFVVGSDVVAAVYRVATDGEWKTNVHRGAKCEECALTPEMRRICLESASIVGLDYTGVDIIEGPSGPIVIELNGSPSWHGLAEATGRDVAADIVRHVLRMLDRGLSAGRPLMSPAA